MPSRTVVVIVIMIIVCEAGGVFCLDITYAEEHTDGRLLCKHEETDDELLRVQWYKSSRDAFFKNGDPAVVSWNGTKKPYTSDNYGAGEDFSLIIYNMSHSDMGIYSCYVIYNIGNNIHVHKYFVRLIVYGGVANAADLIAEHGTLVSLPCRYSLTTDRTGVMSNVLWYKGSTSNNVQSDDQAIASWTNGEKRSDDNYSLNDDFSLEIGTVSSKNEGLYRCIATTNGSKASAGDTQVTAYALPRVLPLLNVTTLPNSTVIYCSVDYVYPLLYPEFGFPHDKEYAVQNEDGTYNTSIRGIVPDNLPNRKVECFFRHFNYTKSSSHYIPEKISTSTLDPCECTERSNFGLIFGVLTVTLVIVIAVIMIKIIMIKRKRPIKQHMQHDVKNPENGECLYAII